MYPIREDSLFLCNVVKKYLKSRDKEIVVLDIGTGSGIQSKNLIELKINKKNITASDIHSQALTEAKKLGIKVIKSNLFNNIKGRFDLIIFNPPYLPEDKYDKEQDTTGGKKGDEIIIKFIEQLNKHLTKNGVCLLLTSNHTPNKTWKNLAEEAGFTVKKIATKTLFFERLYIWEIKLIPPQ